jgi:DNA adenine methylase
MLIRYPGSKDSHLKFLSKPLIERAEQSRSICEPFSGTASVTFHLLEESQKRVNKGEEPLITRYWVNDIDPSLAALWSVVKDEEGSQELVQLIKSYTPAAEDFYAFKENPGDDLMSRAFRKIVLHQISYSGLGAKAGSPIGGKAQKGNYLVDCRWSPQRLAAKVHKCAQLLRSVEGKITNLEWDDVVAQAITDDTFIYLDPPYYAQGKSLYISGSLQHQNVADTLQKHTNSNWLVSYDDAPEILAMYSWANVQPVDVRSHLHHKTISDVMITPRN